MRGRRRTEESSEGANAGIAGSVSRPARGSHSEMREVSTAAYALPSDSQPQEVIQRAPPQPTNQQRMSVLTKDRMPRSRHDVKTTSAPAEYRDRIKGAERTVGTAATRHPAERPALSPMAESSKTSCLSGPIPSLRAVSRYTSGAGFGDETSSLATTISSPNSASRPERSRKLNAAVRSVTVPTAIANPRVLSHLAKSRNPRLAVILLRFRNNSAKYERFVDSTPSIDMFLLARHTISAATSSSGPPMKWGSCSIASPRVRTTPTSAAARRCAA